MDRMVRRKLTMMGRAFDFVRAHPSTDASWAALATRTEELLTRADALTVQERAGGVGGEPALAPAPGVSREPPQEEAA